MTDKRLHSVKRLLLWSGAPKSRGRRYVLITTLGLFVVWGLAIGYITLTPKSYTSEMTIVLPGAGVGTAINLDNIGQATSTVSSPYAGSSLSPTVNYKTILGNPKVLETAAETMGLKESAFGKPRVSLVDQTNLIFVSMTAPTPEEARERLNVLYDAFTDELERLRKDEILKREEASRRLIGDLQDKVGEVRHSILEQQTESGLVALSQFDALVMSMEDMRRTRAQLEADLADVAAEENDLSQVLGVTPDEAAVMFSLSADPVMEALLATHAEASRELASMRTQWGNNHPQVQMQEGRRRAALIDMRARASAINGAAGDLVEKFAQNTATARREPLLSRLVDLQAKRAGMMARQDALSEQMRDLGNRIGPLSVQAARLDDLQRDLQVAEAVFSSALARVDTGKSDLFASYPLVQILATPSLPDRPSSPKKLLALVGATMGTMLLFMSLALLWIRQPILLKLLKSV